MDELKKRILEDGIIIDNRILKIDNFLNQQIDTTLINHVGQEFARRFQDTHIGNGQPAYRVCPQEKIAAH